MEKVDLIIQTVGQLITCASRQQMKKGSEMRDVGSVENGAMAVKQGKIVDVDETEKIQKKYEAEKTIDAQGKVVCPAFVDCHTHIVFVGDRLDEFELKIKGADYLEILENGGGIISTVRKTREASLEQLISESHHRLNKILTLGTATCEVKTGYGLDTNTELKMLEVINELNNTHEIDLIPTFLPAHAVPPEFKGKEEEFTNLICGKILPKGYFWLKKNFKKEAQRCEFYNDGSQSLVREIEKPPPFFADVFCEKGAFSLEQSRRVLEAAKNLGFKLKAHVDEFTNLGGAKMALALDATSIDHLDAISEEEIKLLANSKTVGVVTPTVNFNLGLKHFADARKMIDAGCAIAVSTDYNPGSAPCPSLPTAMAIACRYQKLLPSEALNAATINAAFAIGLGDKIGSIEAGKQADVLILDTDDYRQVAYEFGGNPVVKVIKNGKIIHEN